MPRGKGRGHQQEPLDPEVKTKLLLMQRNRDEELRAEAQKMMADISEMLVRIENKTQPGLDNFKDEDRVEFIKKATIKLQVCKAALWFPDGPAEVLFQLKSLENELHHKTGKLPNQHQVKIAWDALDKGVKTYYLAVCALERKKKEKPIEQKKIDKKEAELKAAEENLKQFSKDLQSLGVQTNEVKKQIILTLNYYDKEKGMLVVGPQKAAEISEKIVTSVSNKENISKSSRTSVP